MLVLTRKLNQSIMIGEMEVFIVEINGDQIRLGINVPKEVAVHRTEIYLQVQQENQAAAKTGTPSTIGKTLDEIRQAKR